jgi:hypothetical protein
LICDVKGDRLATQALTNAITISLFIALDEQREPEKFIEQWFWESELPSAIIITHNSRVDFRINFVISENFRRIVSYKQRGI